MTTDTRNTPRTPPRFLVRFFWSVHRALYRLSGGRFGLGQPSIGKRFGTMRVNTLGRRSGQRRSAIIGYYEDGPSLVTLAMNGWAAPEPAWWLNLQANPNGTVDLPTGERAVRARAATPEERARLWPLFRAYPGWGSDITALATRRPNETAVVILEPREAGSRA